jgi:UDP-N-acetyl-2-amino-2-deoxyglucuronate dehydrogenase
MTRRSLLLAAPLAAAARQSGDVALLTHAAAPHLSAYVEGLSKCPDVRRVFLAGPSAEKEVAPGLGPKLAAVFPSPDALFQQHQPPLALIPMEAALAPPAIRSALQAGCNVMAEKPACVRAEDFAPLAALANSRRQFLMLAFANRIDPVMREARRIVQSPAIGKLYGMEMHLIADQTRLTRPAYHKTWTAQKARAGGGHLIWLGIHWLDLAAFISGSRITRVAGFTGNVGGQPIDTEDSAAITFQFANGTLGTLTSGYYLDKGKHGFLKFWGANGWLEINQEHPEGPLAWQSHGQPVQRWKPTTPAGYTPWVAHAVRAAEGKEPPALTADESLQALTVVFAAYRAAQTGISQSL